MEVHPPDHGIHGWRDVLVHLAIVTAGLFIALTMESGVEWMHKRHLMHVTEHNLQHEFEINQRYFDTDVKSYRILRKVLRHNIGVLQQLKAHPGKVPDGNAGKLVWLAGWEPLTDAQWRTAYQTTGLSLMPQEEVARWAEGYSEAAELNKAWDVAGHHVFALGGYQHVDADAAHLSPAQVDALLAGCGQTLAELQVVGFELMNWAESNHLKTEVTREEVLAL